MSKNFKLLDADIMTHSGQYFPFFRPEEYDFNIFTIAHALSKLCRFTGHTRNFYSVAQHSVLVSHILPPELQKAGLLHDAAEAFIGDMSKPLKDLFPEYKRIEESIEKAIFAKFGVPFPFPPEVKHADLVLLATEQRDLLPKIEDQWTLLAGIEPLEETIEPWSPEEAYTIFMRRFMNLFFNMDYEENVGVFMGLDPGSSVGDNTGTFIVDEMDHPDQKPVAPEGYRLIREEELKEVKRILLKIQEFRAQARSSIKRAEISIDNIALWAESIDALELAPWALEGGAP